MEAPRLQRTGASSPGASGTQGNSSDLRLLRRYAMETHGVQAARLATPLTSTTLQQSGRVAGAFTARFLSALPFLALGLAYLATQYAAYLKVRQGTS